MAKVYKCLKMAKRGPSDELAKRVKTVEPYSLYATTYGPFLPTHGSLPPLAPNDLTTTPAWSETSISGHWTKGGMQLDARPGGGAAHPSSGLWRGLLIQQRLPQISRWGVDGPFRRAAAPPPAPPPQAGGPSLRGGGPAHADGGDRGVPQAHGRRVWPARSLLPTSPCSQPLT